MAVALTRKCISRFDLVVSPVVINLHFSLFFFLPLSLSLSPLPLLARVS